MQTDPLGWYLGVGIRGKRSPLLPCMEKAEVVVLQRARAEPVGPPPPPPLRAEWVIGNGKCGGPDRGEVFFAGEMGFFSGGRVGIGAGVACWR